MKKVYCLYRVSTKKQVDVNTDDIPMQKVECHRFAEAQGWEIVKEFSEKGVSGFKVHADDRDAIQELKKAALNHEFDILLVFMFDRIGRIDDETPFIVEWFVHNGVEVWSVKEGEQRFDNHVDKLMNYIRFWQASGESAKTSLRIKTRMKQLVEEGHYTMGVAPYGYKFVKRGRKNKKGNDVGDLVIDEEEAKHEQKVQALALEKLNNQLEKLQLEIGNALIGESIYSAEDLSNTIKAVKSKITEAEKKLEEAENQANSSRSNAESIVPMFNRFVSWAEEFDKCSIEGKRAIMCELIDRVNVYRGYKIEVVFNSTYEQFCNDWCLSGVEVA